MTLQSSDAPASGSHGNVARLLDAAATQNPERIAITSGETLLAYRDLHERVCALAEGLQNLGLESGARVVIWLKNCPEYIETMFACWKAGFAIVPMNPRLTASEVAFHIDDCSAQVMVYGPHFAADAAQVPVPYKIAIAGSADLDIAYETLAGRSGVEFGTVELPEDSPAWLFYTSGTTGRPKGAVLSHRILTFVVVSWCADLQCLQPEDVVLHCAPLSHGAGFQALTAIARGSNNVIHSRFDPAQVFADIARLRVSASWMVPTQIRMLLDSPAVHDADVSSLRSIVYGGAPMYLDDLREAVHRLGPVFCQLYGQGESPMTISYLRAEEHQLDRPDQDVLASTGIARTGMQIGIVHENGEPAVCGDVGEIIVRGPAVMTGYWGRPDATEETLRGGWLHTGDLGRLDDNGNLYVLDRMKDFVISGGSNVYAREVEDALLKHPAVHEAAVFGVPDRLWGEAVVAAVVAEEGLTAEEILRSARQDLADYKCPKHLYLCDELPKNAYGKVLKRELRDRFGA